MSRTSGAVTPRLRLVLALVVGGALALVLPSLLASTADRPAAVVLAALVIAVAAMAGLNRRIATLVAPTPAPSPSATEESSSFLAGRVADPVHHPIRPRAPGLA